MTTTRRLNDSNKVIVTAALTGKIGALPGIRIKTAYSQFESDE